MSLERYLTEHIKKYPQMQPQDIVKLCYQAAKGAEHLLEDINAAKAYFEEEYAKAPAKEGNLYERISPGTVRIHLSAWKATGMPEEWLFRMFEESASVPLDDNNLLNTYLRAADQVVRTEQVKFTLSEWKDYLEDYVAKGMPAVHHSQEYRADVHPSYRIVNARYLCVLPILEAASKLTDEEGVKILALDGRAAAGKTTRAELLKGILDAQVIHMDDFFLPPALRDEERLSKPGGNVHYERFLEEVLPWIRKKEAFRYRIFDCGIMDYNGYRTVAAGKWRIVEGSYSHHPRFGDYADLGVFCDISAEEQMKRIFARNGAEMAQMFKNRWIPMEERYFKAYEVLEQAEMCMNNEKVIVQK